MSDISYNAILQRMLAQVPDDIDRREGSIIYDALAPTAYALAGQNFMLGYLTNLLFGDTATGEWLDRVVGDSVLTAPVRLLRYLLARGLPSKS